MSRWTITNNILPEIREEIHKAVTDTLTAAGEVYHDKALNECPVSEIDSPGYVHLAETIGYEVDSDSLIYQQWVTFFVIKSYAEFVNNGTSKMAPRPFFTDGLLEVEDKFEGIVEKKFAALRSGKVILRLK